MPPAQHRGGRESRFPPLQRVEIDTPGDERTVYRFVHVDSVTDERLPCDFKSDRACGKRARGRQAHIPELHDGMSVFRTRENAAARWADLASKARQEVPGATIRVGHFIARVELRAGQGLAYEDLGSEDGHMTLWGGPLKLAACVAEIFPAE
jgi:hypothetical protein